MNKKNKDTILKIQEICVRVDNVLLTQEEIIEAALYELIHSDCKFSVLDVEPKSPYFNKGDKIIQKEETEHQEVIVKARCPIKGCKGYTYLSIPEDYLSAVKCCICHKTTPAKDWLS